MSARRVLSQLARQLSCRHPVDGLTEIHGEERLQGYLYRCGRCGMAVKDTKTERGR